MYMSISTLLGYWPLSPTTLRNALQSGQWIDELASSVLPQEGLQHLLFTLFLLLTNLNCMFLTIIKTRFLSF